MEIWWTVLLSILVGALGVYYYLTKNVNYFKERGVPYAKPTLALGSMGPTVFRQKSFTEIIYGVYNEFPDARYFGLFDFDRPVVVLRDPELIKSVTIKNFDNFPNHRKFVDEVLDPLFANNLFALRDERWREIRTLLSPSFTSSKMKMMFKLVSHCGKDLAEYLTTISKTPNDVDMKDSFTRFTNDVIATSAFGISVNSLRDRDNEFYKIGKEATNFSGARTLILLLTKIAPWFVRLFNLKITSDKVHNFFHEVIGSTVATRDAKGITRADMIQLMMQARDSNEKVKLTTEQMTSQAFIFFFAGFETTSTALSFAAYLLGTHPSIQDKLCAEIDEVLAKSEDGELTYEALHGMEYLDAVVNEVLRIYPPVSALDRICTEPFELPPAVPGCKPFVVEAGVNVWLPCFGIQHDPQYFERPEEFDPERFAEINKSKFASNAYFPFGFGPRSCIGNRFALMEVKLALFYSLAKCKFSPCSKTPNPMKFDRSNFNLSSENGYWMKVERRL